MFRNIKNLFWLLVRLVVIPVMFFVGLPAIWGHVTGNFYIVGWAMTEEKMKEGVQKEGVQVCEVKGYTVSNLAAKGGDDNEVIRWTFTGRPVGSTKEPQTMRAYFKWDMGKATPISYSEAFVLGRVFEEPVITLASTSLTTVQALPPVPPPRPAVAVPPPPPQQIALQPPPARSKVPFGSASSLKGSTFLKPTPPPNARK